MRTRFIIGILAFLSISVSAQDSIQRWRLGVECAYARPAYFNDAVYPSITLTSDRHSFFIGPSFTYLVDYPAAIPGGQAGYLFIPNGSDKRLNLLFEYQVSYLQGVLTDRFRPFPHIYSPNSGTRTIHLQSVDNYFSFGVKWNISRWLFCRMTAGLGVSFYKEDYTYSFANGEVFKGRGSIYPRELSLNNRLFKIGMGINLFQWKPKK